MSSPSSPSAPSAPSTDTPCAACGTPGAAKLCSGCGVAHYCSVDCQKADWKAHRPICKAARPALDWTVDGDHSLGLLQYFRHTPLANIDYANRLREAVTRLCRFTATDERPMPLDGAAYKAAVLEKSVMPMNHHVYLVSLDLVSYSLCFETLGGRARVWMAYMGVFTVGQWAQPTPQPGWGARLVAAHARWGGGRDLNREGLSDFIDALLEVRAAATAGAADLLRTLSNAALRKEDERFWQDPEGRAPPIMSFLRQDIFGAPRYPSTVTIFFHPGDCQVPVEVCTNAAHAGQPLSMGLGPPAANRLIAALGALHGQLPSADCLIKMLYWKDFSSAGLFLKQQAWCHTPSVMFKGRVEALGAQLYPFPMGYGVVHPKNAGGGAGGSAGGSAGGKGAKGQKAKE